MAQLSGESSGSSNTSVYREGTANVGLQSKHKVFLSHSGVQKDFVEQLCKDLECWDRYPFFDKRRDSLPIGENFPQHIFEAIRQCQVGVVILSEEFFTRSKWPMIELVAMVREAKKREVGFKIVPVFLHLSIVEFRDPTKRNRWRSCWHELALKDKRIDEKEWEDALKYLEPLNSMVYDGKGEVKFREEIVDVICGAVLPETKLDDSDIEGRWRLCKVIQDKINVLGDEKSEGVVVVGLYGVGGIGKTSICKALCNEYVSRFHGRVCHAELERTSKKELLREVLKRLTSTRYELLDRWNEDELCQKLKSGIMKEPVFLAIDNVSDVLVSIDEAKSYVSARLPSGSIVMVTSRSKETLKLVRRDLVGNNVMEMPELDVEEARSLFCKSYQMESRYEIDDQVVMQCVKQCYFRKGDGSGSYHYHPLSLDVLGKQLANVDENEWEAHLDKIDANIMNHSREADHQLERLRKKSLLENLGDGIKTSISMHDLWRAFCEAEVQAGELRCRRWMYGANGNMELIERCSVGGWENLARMAFDSMSVLKTVNFFNFPNATVLKLSAHYWGNELVLDVSGLGRLMSLDIKVSGLGKLVLLGLPRSLTFVRLVSFGELVRLSLHKLVKQVGYLTKLQHLELGNYSGGKLPDMKSMISLRVGLFYYCKNVVTLTGLGTKLSLLRVLHFDGCTKLRSCPGVGDVVGLEDLSFRGCQSLKKLPNLGKLRNLRKLVAFGCPLINEVPGLDDLAALEELRMGYDSISWMFVDCYRLSLPDMSKLRNLRIVHLYKCRLEALPGFDSLVSLEQLDADFREGVDKPSLRQLTKLQTLSISHGLNLEGLNELNSLAMLRDLGIDGCFGVDNLPDMEGLISLRTLRINNCGFKGVGGLSNLITLDSLGIYDCDMLETLPDLQKLTRLKSLYIINCKMLRKWDCGVGAVKGSSCRSVDNWVGSEVPDSQPRTALRSLILWQCPVFEDVMVTRAFSDLESLYYGGLGAVTENPNLSCFPRLRTLTVASCEGLNISVPLGSLQVLNVGKFHNLSTSGVKELPDLGMFPALKELRLRGCTELTSLRSSVPLPALRELDATGCTSLSGADLDELQALCPQCHIKRDALDEGDVTERARVSRIFRCFRG